MQITNLYSGDKVSHHEQTTETKPWWLTWTQTEFTTTSTPPPLQQLVTKVDLTGVGHENILCVKQRILGKLMSKCLVTDLQAERWKRRELFHCLPALWLLSAWGIELGTETTLWHENNRLYSVTDDVTDSKVVYCDEKRRTCVID